MGWAKRQTVWNGAKLSVLACFLATVIFVQASASVIDRPFFRANAVVIIFSGGDFIENNGEAPLVHDFVLLDNVTSGTEGNDLIAQNGVPVNFPFDPISDGTSGGWPFQITNQTFGGQYDNNPSFQMLDANDSYTAFGIDNSTDIDLLGTQVRFAWFFVASNTAFDLYAQASNLVTNGDFSSLGYDNIGYQLLEFSPASPSIGQRSQLASVGGNGIIIGNNANGFTLDDISGGQTKVYDGGRKTARIPGSIAQQATGFASVYRLRGSPITGNNYDFSLGTGILSADVTYTVFAP
jgi:hypothetical protein